MRFLAQSRAFDAAHPEVWPEIVRRVEKAVAEKPEGKPYINFGFTVYDLIPINYRRYFIEKLRTERPDLVKYIADRRTSAVPKPNMPAGDAMAPWDVALGLWNRVRSAKALANAAEAAAERGDNAWIEQRLQLLRDLHAQLDIADQILSDPEYRRRVAAEVDQVRKKKR